MVAARDTLMETDLHDQQRQRVEEFRKKHRIALLTMLFTDVVGSTRLKQLLGDRAAIALMDRHHAVIRETLARFPEGEEISTAGDSFFIVFAKPSDAAHFALLAQKGVRALARETGHPVLDRIGIHVGEIFIQQRSEAHRDLFGIQIDTAARIMSLGGADQILLSRFAFDNARQVLRGHDLDGVGELSWLNHGYYEMKGVEEPVEVCEVGEVGAGALLAPGDSEKAHRFHSPDAEPVLGWRPSAGQRVPNTQWTLERALGEGGFGEVWLAHHETLKQRRVIKFCFRADRVRSLKREVTIFRILRERVGEQRGIVTVHDVFFDEPPFYIVMDYVDGPNLAEWTTAHAPLADVPLATRLEIVAQVADALQVAHDAGVIHRDVKPSNILVAVESGTPQVKLTDFGIGQVVSAEALAGVTKLGFTQTMLSSSAGTGTQLYMAPELLTGQPATTRSDLYSLGVVLYQLLTGDLARPVTADWPDDIADPLLRDDLRKCLAGDVAKRFAGASQLAMQLRTLAERRAALEREKTRVAALERRAYRRGSLRAAALAFGVVALVAVLAAYAFRQARSARTSARAEAEARGLSDELLTKMQLQRAEQLFDEDDAPGGLAYLASAFRRSPGDHITSARLLSALRDRSYARPIFSSLPHTGSVLGLAWSPDGKRLATVTKDRIHLWDTATGRPAVPPVEVPLTMELQNIRFSPDGRRFVAIGADSQVFDTTTGQAVAPPLVHEGRNATWGMVEAIFLPDGKHIVTASHSSEIKVWEVETGRSVAACKIDGRSEALAVQPDGSHIAVNSRADVILWDWAAQRVEQTWPRLPNGPGGTEPQLIFSPDGSRLFEKERDVIRCFDLGAKKPLPWMIEPSGYILSVDLSGDGRTLAVVTDSHAARFYSAETGEARGDEWPASRYVTRMKYAARGARLLSFTEQVVQVRAALSGMAVCGPSRVSSNIECANLSDDGGRLAIGTAAGEVRLWEISASASQPMLFGPSRSHPPAVLNSDESRLVTSGGSEAFVWDFQTGRRVGTIDHGETFWSLNFHPGGDLFVTGGATERLVRTWDCRTGKNARADIDGRVGGGGLDFSPDGRRIVIGARVWDFVTGKPLTEPLSTRADLNSSAHNNAPRITPDGARVVLSEGRVAGIFEVVSGRLIASVASDAPIHALSLSDDGQVFATGSTSGEVRVWRMADAEPVTPPLGHQAGIVALRFSADGRLLTSASHDRSVRVWSLPDGRPVGTPIQHTEPMLRSVISPDSRRVATYAQDGSVRIWDAQTGRALSDRLPAYVRAFTDLKWTRDGRRLYANGVGLVHVWEVPRPDSDAPSWLADWAEAVAGQRLDGFGKIERVSDEQSAQTAARLANIPGGDLYAETARWFYASPGRKPMSPLSRITLAEYTALLTNQESYRAARAALHVAPGSARAWARYAELILESSSTTTADELNFLLAHAESLNPKEPWVWRVRGLAEEDSSKLEKALGYARRAAELDPDDWRTQWLLGSLLSSMEEPVPALEAAERALSLLEISGYNQPRRRRLMTLRFELLSKLGRTGEALAAYAGLHAIEPRAPEATPRELDLTTAYTDPLDTNPSGVNPDYNLSTLTKGLVTLDGVRWDIRRMVVLRSKMQSPKYVHPVKAADIPVGQSCRRLHFLQACSWTSPNGTKIARWILHYADGETRELPVIFGEDVRDWGQDIKVVGLPKNGREAWCGRPREKDIRLYHRMYENPRPDSEIATLELVSEQSDSAPIVVAVTVE